ncbi:MAG: CBS domain-containing protein, partial [Luteimonas sp.]|nr:CBS domain-containing protein [Luteimonas sp.]
ACMQVVTKHRIRHLPVVESGQVAGMISIGDLVAAVIEDQQHELDQLQRYIAG